MRVDLGSLTSDWNSETIGNLRALWDEGHSTAEIGRRLKTTKNAIVGKAHRLNLPARPSPICRGTPAKARPGPEPVAETAVGPDRTVQEPRAPGNPVKAKRHRASRPAAPIAVTTNAKSCCWPFGEPGRPSFRFCEAAITTANKPYCDEHIAVAYVQPVKARDVASLTRELRGVLRAA